MFVGMDKFGKYIFGNYLDIRNIRKFYPPEISRYTVSSEITTKGTGLAKSAMKENPVELDSFL